MVNDTYPFSWNKTNNFLLWTEVETFQHPRIHDPSTHKYVNFFHIPQDTHYLIIGKFTEPLLKAMSTREAGWGWGCWGILVIVMMLLSHLNRASEWLSSRLQLVKSEDRIGSNSFDIRFPNFESNFLSSIELLLPACRVFNKGLLNWIE